MNTRTPLTPRGLYCSRWSSARERFDSEFRRGTVTVLAPSKPWGAFPHPIDGDRPTSLAKMYAILGLYPIHWRTSETF